jgi:hypothetical protein
VAKSTGVLFKRNEHTRKEKCDDVERENIVAKMSGKTLLAQ